MNNKGQIVGTAEMDAGGSNAFVWNGYKLFDLGMGRGEDINNLGHATGDSCDASGNCQAFLWNGTTRKNLTRPGITYSSGRAINDADQVTGVACDAVGCRAFIWNGTTFSDLGHLGGGYSEGRSINASGQVAGDSNRADGELRAFLWNGTTMRDLGALGGTSSSAFSVNDAGKVTGTYVLPGGTSQAFFWNGTRMLAISPPGTTSSYGAEVTSRGEVLINATVPGMLQGQSYDYSRPYVWKASTRTHEPIGPFGDRVHALANDINENSRAVGASWRQFNLEGTTGSFEGFLWDPQGTQTIDSRVQPGALPPERFVVDGVKINRKNQILSLVCGQGGYETYSCKTYVLTPIT